MQDFRDLKVWQKAHDFTLAVYRATAAWPKEELYGLTSQLRRASVSIGSNIAEGCCRVGDREFARFLQMALGSASEADYQLLLARDLGFLDGGAHSELSLRATEIKRMGAALYQKLTADS